MRGSASGRSGQHAPAVPCSPQRSLALPGYFPGEFFHAKKWETGLSIWERMDGVGSRFGEPGFLYTQRCGFVPVPRILHVHARYTHVFSVWLWALRTLRSRISEFVRSSFNA